MKPTALIVDDEADHATALEQTLETRGFSVTRFNSVGKARAEAGESESANFTIAFLTLHCGDEVGLDLLDLPVLADANEIFLMSTEDEPKLVNRGIARGATYFFCKPFDPSFLGPILTDVAAEMAASQEPGSAAESAIDQFGLLRGTSPPMRRLFRTMRKVAPSDTSVLLIGESGTGKELVAQSLHMFSGRSESDFVAVNCAAIPKDLFESELFGHEKGSFSGAIRQHSGYFEQADGGTLFLDEITEMPLELQAKLLRVLELGEFRRVGGEADLSSDVRIIAATNREPELAIEDESLREDLYYRVARFPIWLPPLRDRGEDISGLALFFLGELNAAHQTAIDISEAALGRIQAYAWPGNVRELRSVLERAFILANERIEPAHLGDLDADTAAPGGDYIRVPADASIEDAERQLIFATLDRHDGDKRAAASSLGISLKTLYNRLNAYADDAEGTGA